MNLAKLLVLIFMCFFNHGVEGEIVRFEGQVPADGGLFDAPEASCRRYSELEVWLNYDRIDEDTGLLVVLPGYGNTDCNPTTITLPFKTNVVTAAIFYRNVSFRAPQDMGKHSIGDVLRGVGAVLDKYSLNTRRLYIFAGSGGGHLGLQVYQASPHLWAEVHIHSALTRINSNLDGSGYGLNWNSNLGYPTIQGGRTAVLWERYQGERTLRSPAYQARFLPRSAAPLWMFHGTSDVTVGFRHFEDMQTALVEAGVPLIQDGPVNRGGNWNFVPIMGGNHGYGGAAGDENTREKASQKYVPDAFTRSLEENPILAVDYISPPANGYHFAVEGVLREATVRTLAGNPNSWALW